MAAFSNNKSMIAEMISKATLIAKGKTLSEAGRDLKWMFVYGQVARRCLDDKDFGLTRDQYEHGLSLGPFTGEISRAQRRAIV